MKSLTSNFDCTFALTIFNQNSLNMKSDIIAQLIDQQEQAIKELEIAYKRQMEDADLDETNTIDDDDYSQQSAGMDLVSFYQDQRQIAERNIANLKQYQFMSNNKVGEGALVTTNDKKYLFGAPFKNLKYGDTEVIGISVDSPAYKNNEGKVVDQMLKLGEHEKQIQSIE